jgi:glutaredoxin
MPQALDCRYVYHSLRDRRPSPELAGEWVDLAQDPSAAHALLKLGVSPRNDLPALILSEPGGKIRLLALGVGPTQAVEIAAGRLPSGDEGRGDLTLYGASWCPDCRRAKLILGEAGVAYDEVNLDEDATAEALVLARSGGRRVIPTLLFDRDGGKLWAFNPEPALLQRLIAA